VTAAAVSTPFLRPAERVLPSGRRMSWQASSPIVPAHEAEKSYPVPVWSGLISAKHRSAMGMAIWMFLWCIDRITIEKDGWGIVLGGAPVKDEVIRKLFEIDKETVHAFRQKLLAGRYITALRTPYGFVYRVRNSRKFRIWQKKRVAETGNSPRLENPENPESPTKENPGNSGITPQENPENPDRESGKHPLTKKTQQYTAVKADAAADSRGRSVWDFLRIPPCGPDFFRSDLENRWASRNGEKPSAVIGDVIDGWEATHDASPRGCARLFQALSELRKTERRETETARRPRTATADDVIPKEH
jgi:hypothetical protein